MFEKYKDDFTIYESWFDVLKKADSVDRDYFRKLYVIYGPDGIKFPKAGIHSKQAKMEEAFILFLGVASFVMAMVGLTWYLATTVA